MIDLTMLGMLNGKERTHVDVPRGHSSFSQAQRLFRHRGRNCWSPGRMSRGVVVTHSLTAAR